MHVCAKPFQSRLTLCGPLYYSPPGSSVHEILQARTLERVAMPHSRGSSQPRDGTQASWRLLHRQVSSLPLHHLGRPGRYFVYETGLPSSSWTLSCVPALSALNMGHTCWARALHGSGQDTSPQGLHPRGACLWSHRHAPGFGLHSPSWSRSAPHLGRGQVRRTAGDWCQSSGHLWSPRWLWTLDVRTSQNWSKPQPTVSASFPRKCPRCGSLLRIL